MGSNTEKNVNSSVMRSLLILEYLSERDYGVSAIELCTNLSFNKATTYNLLYTLEECGYVSKRGDGKYHLTNRILILGNQFIHSQRIIGVFRQCTTALRRKYECCFNLASLNQNGNAIVLDSINTDKVGAGYAMPGSSLPLHATSTGKALLAFSSKHIIKKYMESPLGTFKYTKHTITTYPDMLREIGRIQLQGYALDNKEYNENTCCSSAPIFDNNNKIVAAVSISGQSEYVMPRRPELIEETKKLAKRISTEIAKLE